MLVLKFWLLFGSGRVEVESMVPAQGFLKLLSDLRPCLQSVIYLLQAISSWDGMERPSLSPCCLAETCGESRVAVPLVLCGNI